MSGLGLIALAACKVHDDGSGTVQQQLPVDTAAASAMKREKPDTATPAPLPTGVEGVQPGGPANSNVPGANGVVSGSSAAPMSGNAEAARHGDSTDTQRGKAARKHP